MGQRDQRNCKVLGFIQVCPQLKVPPQTVIYSGLGLFDASKHHLCAPGIGRQSKVGLDNLGVLFQQKFYDSLTLFSLKLHPKSAE